MNEVKKSKVAARLQTEVTQSRTSSLKARIAAISSHSQEWAASGRTNKTEAEECKAWQAYGVRLALHK
jgi:hypothetical protein